MQERINPVHLLLALEFPRRLPNLSGDRIWFYCLARSSVVFILRLHGLSVGRPISIHGPDVASGGLAVYRGNRCFTLSYSDARHARRWIDVKARRDRNASLVLCRKKRTNGTKYKDKFSLEKSTASQDRNVSRDAESFEHVVLGKVPVFSEQVEKILFRHEKWFWRRARTLQTREIYSETLIYLHTVRRRTLNWSCNAGKRFMCVFSAL